MRKKSAGKFWAVMLEWSPGGLFMSAQQEDPLETELMRYENKWVAILQTERRVVGSGNTAYDAKTDAEKNGYPETALFMVQPPGRYRVLALPW